MSEINKVFLELNCSNGGGSSKWLQLLPDTVNIIGCDGRKFTNSNPARIVKEFNAKGKVIPLDYDHGTELLSKVGSAPAAGWISKLKLENNAIFGLVEFTPKGKDSVEGVEYRYLSPALNCKGSNKEIISISSAALTNKPNLDIAALNNKDDKEILNMKNIATKLGLNLDASEDSILLEIDKMQTELNSKQDAPDPNEYMPKADYDNALARAEAAEKKLAELENEKVKVEANSTIENAMAAGKITPASKEHYLELCHNQEGLEKVKKALGVAPKVVGTEGDKSLEQSSDLNNNNLTTEQVELCHEMGISEEDFAKEIK